jgi:hypothetical protein
MVEEWIHVMSSADVRTAWGIPAAAYTELGNRFGAAQAALQKAKDDSQRTPVVNAQCNAAFDAMEAYARDFKRRHFFEPPLTDADLVSLGLRPRDPHPTPSGKPEAKVRAEPYLLGRRELGFKIVFESGDPGDKANEGFRVYHTLTAPGEPAPTAPLETWASFFTRRKKDKLEFGYADSGKTAHFAVQIENHGIKGDWGSLTSGLVP